MKLFILFTVLLFSCLNCISQQDTVQVKKNETYNYSSIDKKPEFPGGAGAFYKYIGNNYRTPSIQGLSGKVYVNFVIEKDGSVVEAKVLRDLGYGTGEEAVRVLSESPKWSPGIQNGLPVRVMYSLPITIQSTR
ncbi:MAG: energy transducer TonB [Flavobacterium sp.]|jgi:protein TonB|nr:energy transducer TonB [Flavobacterium sp.]